MWLQNACTNCFIGISDKGMQQGHYRLQQEHCNHGYQSVYSAL